MIWSASITRSTMDRIQTGLLRPDRDEHAAFMYAGLADCPSDRRLLIRDVDLVPDDEFIPSDRGAYRQITPRAVARAAIKADRLGLSLVWAHSHPMADRTVGFSRDDLATHHRAHPTLIELTQGRPVGSLLFGEHAVAGEVWTADGPPAPLSHLRVLGPHLEDLRAKPTHELAGGVSSTYLRQVLMFGIAGQRRLSELCVAIVGAGGGGSLLVQMLCHLGVGRVIVIDPDIISVSNLSRVVGATQRHLHDGLPKVSIAAAMAAEIPGDTICTPIVGDITYVDDAMQILGADFAFLATDTAHARHAFNLITHQYLIPGIQVGAKVTPAPDSDGIGTIHVMNRSVLLGTGCLHCAGAIPAAELHRELQTEEERNAQHYIHHGNDIDDPSVITLNSIATAHAATDFMFAATGLATGDLQHRVHYPLDHRTRRRPFVKTPGCLWCGTTNPLSAYARGDLWPLQLRPGASPAHIQFTSEHLRTRSRRHQLSQRFRAAARAFARP